MRRYFPGSFFSRKFSVDTWKGVKGGDEKGPAMRPRSTSFCIFLRTISGNMVVNFLFGGRIFWGWPIDCSEKPFVKPWRRYFVRWRS